MKTGEKKEKRPSEKIKAVLKAQVKQGALKVKLSVT